MQQPIDVLAETRERPAGSGPRLPGQGPIVVDDDLALDLGQAEAHTPAGTVRLTGTEVRLLRCLMHSEGQAVAAADLIADVWGRGSVSPEMLRTTVHHLRRKLEPEPGVPRYLLTEHGFGYRLAGLHPGGPCLTAQQREVLRYVTQGYTDNEIAVALGLSSRTINGHVARIRHSLRARSRAHAVALAMQHGLLPDLDVMPGDPPLEF